MEKKRKKAQKHKHALPLKRSCHSSLIHYYYFFKISQTVFACVRECVCVCVFLLERLAFSLSSLLHPPLVSFKSPVSDKQRVVALPPQHVGIAPDGLAE